MRRETTRMADHVTISTWSPYLDFLSLCLDRYSDEGLSDILSLPIVYLSFQVYIQVMVKDRGCYYIIVAISLGFSIRTLSNSGLTSLGLQLQDKCRIDNLN